MYQSFNCQERLPRDRPRWAYEKSTLNGDGFGVGWYVGEPYRRLLSEPFQPCVFRSLKPAWSDRNLKSLAAKTASNLIFAHVRAAGPGSGDSAEGNCHPYNCGRFMFMHNGVVGQWERSRRALMKTLQTNTAIDFALDHTPIDSVVIFAMFIDLLDKGVNARYSPNELRAKLEQVLLKIISVYQEEKIEDVSYINVAITDGETIIGSRHAIAPFSAWMNSSTSPRTGANPRDMCPSLSLYFASGTEWSGGAGDGEYHMAQVDNRREICILTSEPLTEVRDEWVPIPHNHLIVITNKCDISLVPIKGTKATLMGCLDPPEDCVPVFGSGLLRSPYSNQENSVRHMMLSNQSSANDVVTLGVLEEMFEEAQSRDEISPCGESLSVSCPAPKRSAVLSIKHIARCGMDVKPAVESDPQYEFTYMLAGNSNGNISIWRDGVLISSIRGRKDSILSVQLYHPDNGN